MSNTEMPPPAPAPVQPPPVPVKASNGLATAGFVLGLLGFLGSWIPVVNFIGILLAIIGVVLAAVGLSKSTKLGAGKGLAIAGLVLGVLAVLIAIVINVAVVSSVSDSVDKATSTDVKVPTSSGAKATTDAKAADDELGTTRQNPAPLGSEITGDDWTVKINSVKTVSADSLGQKPKAGKKLMVINLTATYNGDDSQGDSAWASVKFVSADGTTVDSTDGFFVADDSFDSLKKVYEGASVKGNKILEVPADWQTGVIAVSPALLSDDTFIAVK